ncbi:MAG: GNAT family N-acetyltransferase [Candidatus Eremiobacteraeota bacterium]|nr:GNAT family N-acetyltransferase [Candidatus Eremiobacteraeota bacterium]
MIRPMEEKDCPEVIGLHMGLIADADFPVFGKGFMKELYGAILTSPFAVPLVLEEEGEVTGFIVGATSSPKLFRDILSRRALPLALSVIGQVVRRPRMVARIMDILFYTRKTSLEDIEAEMPYIALSPRVRGKGMGRHLVREVLMRFREQGIARVKVTAHKDNEGPNRLLAAMGFTLEGTLFFLGKAQNLYWGVIEEVLAKEGSWSRERSQ